MMKKLYIYSIRAQSIKKHLNQITQPLFTCIPIYLIAKPVNFTSLINQLIFTFNPSQYILDLGWIEVQPSKPNSVFHLRWFINQSITMLIPPKIIG